MKNIKFPAIKLIDHNTAREGCIQLGDYLDLEFLVAGDFSRIPKGNFRPELPDGRVNAGPDLGHRAIVPGRVQLEFVENHYRHSFNLLITED